MFWSKRVRDMNKCPECGSRLERENHVYVLAIRRHKKYETFVIGNDGGHFCARCPIVVLDFDVFSRMAALAEEPARGGEFAVLGIVDLDAVPKEKARLPLGTDDNPIPLIEFQR